jgi:SPP1 gp7 family putative phage head morphogenesis protein
VFTDLKNTTEEMAKRLEVVLVDGLIQGKQPYAMIEDVQKAMGVSAFRAETIARTEIIRANAEGNLDAMEALGVEEVGVLVEWSTAGDQRVCGLCSALDGITLKIKESHNLLPRHPNCRCAFIPANVGEDDAGQARSKEEVEERLAESIRREKVGITPEEARQQSKWGGADFEPEKKTPEEMGDRAPTSKDQAELSAALDRVVAGLQSAARQRQRQ